MNTIIATKKKNFFHEQRDSNSDTSITKIKPNNIIIQKTEKNSNNDITNSYQDTLNSFDKKKSYTSKQK